MSKPNQTLKEISNLFDEYLAKNGIKMSKEIDSGFSGFFFNKSPTYDSRTVYTIEDLKKLNKEGFSSGTDLGNFIFNFIYENICIYQADSLANKEE